VFRFTAWAAFSLLALSACNKDNAPPSDSPDYAKAAFAPYPGAEVRFYDVYGTDAKSIRGSLNAFGPQDQGEGRHYDARTNWNAQWHWPGGPDGQCDLAHLEYSFHIIVILPHLQDQERVSPALRREWRNYMAALIEHESGHAKHADAHKEDIENAVKSSSCENANAAGAAAITELGKFDVEYDAETHHGATQGARFPG
jgi:predicted secreted Zn-dependent protease